MKQLNELKNITKICKVCFNELKPDSFHYFLNDLPLCYSCLKKMNPIFKDFKIDNIKALTIFNYNDYIKKLIYQYKGCYDYELKDIFLYPFLKEIKDDYRSFYMVIAPSSEKRIKERGFDHTYEIFKCLKLKIITPIVKINNDKQSDKSLFERQKVIDSLKLVDKEIIANKKILLVDDICTTGSTLKAMISLLKMGNPKIIKVLVIAKRDFTKKELEKLNDPSFVFN